MIQGVTKNIGLPPIGAKELDPKENFVPFNIDLRNGNISKVGNWGKRNGYAENWDISFADPVDSLIPVGNGFAVTEEGRVYDLFATSARITGQDLTGTGRPQFAKFEDDVIIVDGSSIVLDTLAKTTSDTGFAIAPKYIGRVGAYTLYAGYDDTEFTWSAANNPTNITTGDSGFANVKKTGNIKYATDFRNKWVVFKDNEIEVWHNRGGATPFVILNELTIPIGLGASYSVVKANQILFWIDTDKKIRVLSGASAQIISGQYESYLFDKIQNLSEVYGFNYEKEHAIRWFSPTDGICIKYDYENQLITEDNHYEHGQFERLPHNSYMELNGKQYFGDFDPTGKIFEWSEDFNTDNGQEIRIFRKFRIKLSETDNKTSANQLRFMFKRGEGVNGSKAKAHFTYSFDDNSNSETRIIDLGTINEKNPDVTFSRLGNGRQMEIELVMTDASDFLLTGAKLITKELGR